ncbi:MAG: VCBS repeat-containing protein [Ferruginibacter sp.]
MSAQGPKLAVADVNNDGMDDFYVCGAKDEPGKLFIQNSAGKFSAANEKIFAADSAYEEVNALFFDADGDGDKDLYLVSGGDETEKDSVNLDRLYLNDGKGNFSKSNSLPLLFGNKSVAVAADADHDGDMDLFVGGRVVAGRYGDIPVSYLLLNNGKGKFSVATATVAPGLQHIGMVTDAAWTDIDKDGWPDLVITGEWMPITIFKNQKGKLVNVTTAYGLEHTKGLWTTLYIADINNDGFDDILAGNIGDNTKLHASEKFPLELYVGDFDNNGDLDQIMAIEKNGSYYPFMSKEELEGQLPSVIKKKYLGYASFAGQTVQNIFGEKLDHAKKMTAELLSSVVLMNNKNNGFIISSLPSPVQWSPAMAFYTADFNGDGATDIFSAGNFYGVLPYEGRYDASYGTVLLNEKNNSFKTISNLQSGIMINGEVRDIKMIKTKKGNIIAVALNNDAIKFNSIR